ncbi:methyltransferase domain-containing protein [Mycolicibacterium aichiense]|uniref:methyltransferase domain-containing protein n=1 Tax=Mycolicibacterium aichiense TaxID=1799 RepID=UPI003D66CA02
MVQIRIPKPWLISALRRETDYQRWTNPRSIYTAWEPRTQRAASFVPDGSNVIEFGAATRVLEKFLDPSCSYTPSDIVDRGPGTLVLDLNERPLPDLVGYDVAVMMGVLEYIVDVPEVADWLREHFRIVMVCYACADPKKRSLRARFGSLGRVTGGWMNNYRVADLRSVFVDRGYTVSHEEDWKEQRMFIFSQEPAG